MSACRGPSAPAFWMSAQPAKVARKMGAQSEHAHVACTCFFFARLSPTCMLSRCLVAKISESELRRKLIKSALLVGWWRERERRGACDNLAGFFLSSPPSPSISQMNLNACLLPPPLPTQIFVRTYSSVLCRHRDYS